MATRSFISVKLDDKYRTIYCHYDGYPSHAGRILKNEYTDLEEVIGLIELGDLSALCEGGTISYHRDRGEAYKAPKDLTYEELIEEASASFIEFVYVFDKDRWTYLKMPSSIVNEL